MTPSEATRATFVMATPLITVGSAHVISTTKLAVTISQRSDWKLSLFWEIHDASVSWFRPQSRNSGPSFCALSA